jgi:hypothetical protein
VNVETKEQSAVKTVDAHIFIKQAEQIWTNVCQKANGSCFLRQEMSANGELHATMDHNNTRSVLRNTKEKCIGPFRTKGVECWHTV